MRRTGLLEPLLPSNLESRCAPDPRCATESRCAPESRSAALSPLVVRLQRSLPICCRSFTPNDTEALSPRSPDTCAVRVCLCRMAQGPTAFLTLL